MANISFIDVGNNTIHPLSLPYCTCATAKGTAAKTATLANFTLVEGCCVHVKFTYNNTAATPTLNINGTGAIPIVAYGTAAPSVTWQAGAVIEFIYDGTSYVMTNSGAFQNGANSGVVSTHTVSGPTVNVSGAASGFTPSSSTTSYYVTVTGSQTDAGTSSAGAKGSVTTAGYLVKAQSAESAIDEKTINANITGSGDKIYIPVGSCTVAGGALTKGTASGGVLSGGALSSGSGSVTVTSTNVSLTNVSSQPTSGYYITAQGSGSVTRANINVTAFSQSVTRDVVTDEHDAGYITAQTPITVISAATQTVSLAAQSITTGGSKSSNTATKYYTIPSGAIAASGSVSAGASFEVSPGTISIANNNAAVSGKTRVACTPSSATTGITKYYMAVKATSAVSSGSVAITGSGTATASVTTEGYVPSTLTATGEVSVTGSASAVVTSKNSPVYYVPIASAANSGVVSTHTVSGPTVTVSGTATGFTPLSGSETSPYYVTASVSQSTYGWSSAKAKGSITQAGYIEVSESSESSLDSVQINANLGGSKKVYIPAGVITNNTSGGSSSGTIASGQQIKIGKGFYPNDLYYTAQAGGGGWTSGTFTKVGSPGNPDEQSLYVWAGDYNSSWVSVGGGYSAKFGACTHYMSNKSTSNELCDYYQFGSCTQAEPLKVIILSGSSNWAIFFGTFNYEPSTSGNNYYYLDLSTTVAGKTFLFEIYPDNSTGNIQYRYKET